MPVRFSHILLMMSVSACTGKSNDTGVPETLPEDTADTTPSDTIDWNVEDTGLNGGYGNEEPPFELDLMHEGLWELLPLGGPFTSMVGEMHVTELLDGNKTTPWCDVTFSLTGQAIDEPCDTCDFGFIILFYLIEEGTGKDNKGNKTGTLNDCRSPDLPTDGETRILGYSDLDSTIYYNYQDSDIWIPWYDASELHDEVNFAWEATMGFVGEEED